MILILHEEKKVEVEREEVSWRGGGGGESCGRRPPQEGLTSRQILPSSKKRTTSRALGSSLPLHVTLMAPPPAIFFSCFGISVENGVT